jgi:hypothetical protein
MTRKVGLIIILLLAFWLGARSLNVDILFVDEYWSIRNSAGEPFGGGLPAIWRNSTELDPGGMGILYHLLLAGFQEFMGSTVYTVRLFSLFTGLLAIAMTYRVGREMFSQQVGFYAALVMGTSAFFIDYLHEARAYTLLAFFALVVVYSYYRLLHHTRWWHYPLLTLSLAAVAYTHYVALAMGAVVGVIHLFQLRQMAWRKWWSIVACMALGGILFLPWLGITLEVVQRGMGDVGRQEDSMLAGQIISNFLYTMSNANIGLLALFALLSLRNRRLWMAWTWVIVSVLLVLLINSQIPFMVHLRYLMFVLPAIALVVAVGMQQLERKGLSMMLLIVVWGGAGIYQSFTPAFIDDQFGQIYRAPAEGFNQARAILDQRAEVDDLALLHIIPPTFEPFNYFVLDYYFEHTGLRYDQFERMNNSFAGSDNDYLKDVNAVFSDVGVVWTMVIPEVPKTQRSNVVNYTLDTQFHVCETIVERDDMLMQLWVRAPEREPIASFGDVRMFDMQRGFLDESHLHVVLGFEMEDVPQYTYSVALQFFSPDGTFISTTDFPLPNERPFACTATTLAIPDGDYELRAVIYDPTTQERIGDYIVLRSSLSRPE